jgi:hypothetical protein
VAKEWVSGGDGAAAAAWEGGAPGEPPRLRALHRRPAPPRVAPHLLACEFDSTLPVPRCSFPIRVLGRM